MAEIGGASERGDRIEVRRVAHKLKGSSASLGAIRLGACCQKLELDQHDDVPLSASQLTELRGAATQAAEALRYELSH